MAAGVARAGEASPAGALGPQRGSGLCDLGLSPISCSASPPSFPSTPPRPRRPLPICSADPHRGVHTHPGLPGAAVPRVGGRGWRGMASGAADGRFPHRGESSSPQRWWQTAGAPGSRPPGCHQPSLAFCSSSLHRPLQSLLKGWQGAALSLHTHTCMSTLMGVHTAHTRMPTWKAWTCPHTRTHRHSCAHRDRWTTERQDPVPPALGPAVTGRGVEGLG